MSLTFLSLWSSTGINATSFLIVKDQKVKVKSNSVFHHFHIIACVLCFVIKCLNANFVLKSIIMGIENLVKINRKHVGFLLHLHWDAKPEMNLLTLM